MTGWIRDAELQPVQPRAPDSDEEHRERVQFGTKVVYEPDRVRFGYLAARRGLADVPECLPRPQHTGSCMRAPNV